MRSTLFVAILKQLQSRLICSFGAISFQQQCVLLYQIVKVIYLRRPVKNNYDMPLMYFFLFLVINTTVLSLKDSVPL